MAKKKAKRKARKTSSNLACFRSGVFMCKAENYIDDAREATKKGDGMEVARLIGLAARQAIAAGRIILKVAPKTAQPSIKQKVEEFRTQAQGVFFSAKDLVIPRTLDAIEGLDDIRDELWKNAAGTCGLREKKT